MIPKVNNTKRSSSVSTIESSLPLPKLVEINNNATKKIAQYIQSNPEIKFNIVTTVPVTKEPLYQPAMEIFKNSVKTLETNVNVTISEINEIPIEEIEGKHPNAAATINLMAQIANITLGKDLVISTNPQCQVMKSTLKYKGVRALFISSCNGCSNGLTHEEQKKRTGVCHKCLATTMAYSTSITDEHNPPIQDGELPAE